MAAQLPIPEFFSPTAVGQVWRVPYQQLSESAANWSARFSIRPAMEDTFRTGLLLIDCQNTFCIPGFELYVGGRTGRGAVDDTLRICEFIYRNLASLTQIIVTLDVHTATQIFHPQFFVDAAGQHPPPMTAISLDDIENGRWRVHRPAIASCGLGDLDLDAYVRHYCQTLAKRGKYNLMIWPYHAMQGGIGQALVSSIEEACFFHNLVRSSQTVIEQKGRHCLTENYSALCPELLVDHAGQRLALPNQALIERLLSFDRLIIAGQAKSHCVAWTVADLLEEIRRRDSRLADKIYLLQDCTSPVVAPGIVDFSESAEAAFAAFAQHGVHVTSSTAPAT